MESSVREKLIQILAKRNSHHRGMGITRATEMLAFFKITKKYIVDVYGKIYVQDEMLVKRHVGNDAERSVG